MHMLIRVPDKYIVYPVKFLEKGRGRRGEN